MEALNEILPSITDSTILFGDFNFDPQSQHLSTTQQAILEVLQEKGFEQLP